MRTQTKCRCRQTRQAKCASGPEIGNKACCKSKEEEGEGAWGSVGGRGRVREGRELGESEGSDDDDDDDDDGEAYRSNS